MPHAYPRALWALPTALLLAPLGEALAQAPVITAVIPMANARAAARNSPVTVSFNQPLTAASAGALKVFSSQRGGLRTRGATPAVVSGSALSFAPSAYPFMPGETVQYTVTPAAAGAGGALARGRVGQFTAAVGGTGGGNFGAGADLVLGQSFPVCVVAGDVDGDGDLDLLTANQSSNTVSVRLNNGGGIFGGSQNLSVGSSPNSVALGDVDGDGDLDLLASNLYSNTVSVRLNNGNGTFSGSQNVGVGQYPTSVAIGDVDGDGDLDLLASTGSVGTYEVSVRLNDGNGLFSGTQNVSVGSSPISVAVGDVDGDGDLDLLNANTYVNTVSVRLNNGSGLFTGGQEVSVDAYPYCVALGDADGDGDLDLFVTAYTANAVSVRFNNGSGIFSGGQNVGVGPNPYGLALGDVNGDGSLDLLAASSNNVSGNPGTISIRVNNGNGLFSGTQEVLVGRGTAGVAVADADGDGDLDLFATNASGNTVSVRLNGGTGPLATADGRPTGYDPATPTLALFPNPAHGTTTLTGAAPNAPLTVLDALGRVLLTATADAAGTARLALPAGLPTGLPAGVYLVRCGGQVRRLAVE